jgi:hypothetical protein
MHELPQCMSPHIWSKGQSGSFSQANISEWMGRLIGWQKQCVLSSYRLVCAEIKEWTNQNVCKNRRRSNGKISSDMSAKGVRGGSGVADECKVQQKTFYPYGFRKLIWYYCDCVSKFVIKFTSLSNTCAYIYCTKIVKFTVKRQLLFNLLGFFYFHVVPLRWINCWIPDNHNK